MTDSREVTPPWGKCIVVGCNVICVRCLWGFCEAHCNERHVDTTGTKLHSATTEYVTTSETKYTPSKARLVAITKLNKEAA